MRKSVIVWIYLLRLVCTDTIYNSKACYGSGNLSCVRHDIICNSSQKIAIYDAYFTNNTECGAGVSNCLLNPDNVTEHGNRRFNNTELISLYRNCSIESRCVFQGPRRGDTLTFSVVKYLCIEGDTLNIARGMARICQALPKNDNKTRFNCSIQNDTCLCSFKSFGTATGISVYALDVRLNKGKCLSGLSVRPGNVITTNNCSKLFQPFEELNVTTELPLHMDFKDIPKHSSIWLLIKGTNTGTRVSISPGPTKSNTGAIAGGVVATVLVVLVLTLVSVNIIRHRRVQSEGKEKTASLPKDAKSELTYSLAGTIPQGNYHEIQDLSTQNSGYDYVTTEGVALPTHSNTYFTIEPAGKLIVKDNSAVSAAEGDYDHIGDKPSKPTSDYDTTASVAEAGNTGENSYGYNHFQNKVNSQTHQNDYDTAASATQTVAKIGTTERSTDEDDYDHLHRTTNASKTVSSPYDTTSRVEDNSDYFVAGQVK
ncbi:uncharacterized protein [Haliotis asinina]|uniref:uncharacterized protein isoform X1 n=1 Tax=Haliotis asinina TaxID=109174 RepID=UPI003531C8D9